MFQIDIVAPELVVSDQITRFVHEIKDCLLYLNKC